MKSIQLTLATLFITALTASSVFAVENAKPTTAAAQTTTTTSETAAPAATSGTTKKMAAKEKMKAMREARKACKKEGNTGKALKECVHSKVNT